MDRYEIIREIGSGGYGEVFLADDKLLHKNVALKQIPLDENGDLPLDAIRESYLLTELKHDNIVRLERIFVTDNHVILVLELCDMDLIAHFRWYERTYITMTKDYLKQILSAIHHCHSHGVVHSDLKPENILFNKRSKCFQPENILFNKRSKCFQLCDFGCVRGLLRRDMLLTPKVTTLSYMAPEMLLGLDSYSTAVDMWSFGCIFALMIDDQKRIIFKGETELEVLERIFRIMGTPTEDSLPGVSALPEFPPELDMFPSQGLATIFPTLEPTALDLLSRCLCLDPARRISAEDALHHEFLSK